MQISQNNFPLINHKSSLQICNELLCSGRHGLLQRLHGPPLLSHLRTVLPPRGLSRSVNATPCYSYGADAMDPYFRLTGGVALSRGRGGDGNAEWGLIQELLSLLIPIWLGHSETMSFSLSPHSQ